MGELKSSGGDGASLESTFRRLLSVKTKSQYQSASVSLKNAQDAVSWAQRMLDVANDVVSRP